MANRFFNRFFKFALVAVFAMVAMASCDKDDDEGDDLPDILVEDGFYLKGIGTSYEELDTKGKFETTRNEVVQEDRTELKEVWVAVGAGKTFSIIEVVGGEPTTYGPGSDFAEVAADARDTDEPKDGKLYKGSFEASETAFAVANEGLYHVVIDTELKKVAVTEVAYWGLIGGATPGGWSEDTKMEAQAFDLTTMTFEVTDVVMLANEYKFRYSGGWKVILDADYDLGGGNTGVKVNTNFGGATDALVPGGDNIANAEAGVYTAQMVWTAGEGFSATMTKTGDYTPPAFPDAMFIVGDAVAYGWPTTGPGEDEASAMHKCAGGAVSEGIFWKICYIESGKGFKVSAEGWGDPNLGFAEVDEYDANGVAISDNGGNMSVAESGMYMVVLNLQDDTKKLSVIAPEVYGIGDAFGGWNEDVAANLFTVDNTAKTLTSPALTADGNIRMYAQHAWIQDWWNAEFNVFEGVIEYRNDGGDQAAVAGTAGQVITLSFDDNTGTIE